MLYLIKVFSHINRKNALLMGIGDWGLGIGDWGLGIGDWALYLIHFFKFLLYLIFEVTYF